MLHLTWIALFVTFVTWFGFAPFAKTIQHQFSLTDREGVAIGICNVVLTLPFRIYVGMAIDRFGPRRVYGALLFWACGANLMFGFATNYGMLLGSRLAMGVVGAGFVVGIRVLADWFPSKDIGTAEGVYGGWGNSGAAFAALVFPVVAGLFGGDEGWRWTAVITGVLSGTYGLFYLRSVSDTPASIPYSRPVRQGALEVTSRSGVIGLLILTVPLFAALLVFARVLYRLGALSNFWYLSVSLVILVCCAERLRRIVLVNRFAWMNRYPEADQYSFRTVTILCLAYAAAFGAELAVITLLPSFFTDTWGGGAVPAGVVVGVFSSVNLIGRPVGGLFSDLSGDRVCVLRKMLAGFAATSLLLTLVGVSLPVFFLIVGLVACSFFMQASEGAVFAMVPLVKKPVTGQIAGFVSAYGNLGSLFFLAVRWYFGMNVVFFCMALAAFTVGILTFFVLSQEENRVGGPWGTGEMLLVDALPPNFSRTSDFGGV